jgi:predicted RNA-binding protein with PIN domain
MWEETMREKAGVPLYFIDGYNVILSGRYGRTGGKAGKSRRGGATLEDERFLFQRILSEYVRKKRVRMTVVWDGGSAGMGARSETKNGVRNIYTPFGLSADEQIVRMVEKRANPREVTVVSNDRRHVTGVVRNLGAKTMSVSQFLGLISPNTGGNQRQRAVGDSRDRIEETVEKKKADDLSVDEWLQLFALNKRRGGNES